MEVCIIGPNLHDQGKGSFHVHKAGCLDIKRNPIYRFEETDWIVDLDSVQDVVEVVYMDIMEENRDDGYWKTWEAYESDFHFCPCCNGLRREK